MRFFYHNDGWSGTVSAWKFFWDMFALRKKAVVHFNEFDVSSKNQVVLSFDDGYKNFLKYAFPILKLFQYKFELFVIGEYYTGDTISERNLVRNWMSKKDLVRIVQTSKGRLQYHTRTHYRLTDLEDTEMLEKEIRLPEGLQQLDPAGFSWLAYPYCNFNDRIIEIVKKYYQGARAGPNGKARDHPDAVFAMQSIMVHQGTNGGAAFVKEDRDLSFPETPA
ncbi:MAG: polysaccharide deacetylase family protein [Treponema sp.]|nr:polysaccharide deacetylase family protein [Treponema sp.]